jgi:methionyl-tRNA formyltransferase
VRTVYLGTSDFAVAVLERLAQSAHRPALVITRPDRPKGRGRRTGPPPVADAARALGIDLLQPEDLHSADTLGRIAAAEPDVLIVCAFGALVKEPLLSGYEIVNVHPSLLPRWRGAAPIERAIMAGDAETGVSIIRLTAGLDSGPVCLQEREPIAADDDYGTLATRLLRLSGELLVRALDERPPYVEQAEEGIKYAAKIGLTDRALDPTRKPERVERVVRALRPHIGARIPLPDGTFLGVWDARVPGLPTVAPAGGRLRHERDRLFLDCAGGALELLEVQPPGGRRMAASEWLRGRPDPSLTDFWMDPTLPHQPIETVVRRAIEEWSEDVEWAPFLAALCYRGSEEVLAAMRKLARSEDSSERGVAAYVLGQLGVPRTLPDESAAELEALAEREQDPRVLAAIAHAFANLGDPYGTEVLLRLGDHADAAVRAGVVEALTGRENDRAIAALIRLSADPDDDIRDWATFALGAICTRDTEELREALVARLDDECEEPRLEAVHGLAVRGDVRAVEAALELLAADAQGNGHGLWGGHALEEAAIRLAALTGDERFHEYLPELDERWHGTELGKELERAIARTTGDITA